MRGNVLNDRLRCKDTIRKCIACICSPIKLQRRITLCELKRKRKETEKCIVCCCQSVTKILHVKIHMCALFLHLRTAIQLRVQFSAMAASTFADIDTNYVPSSTNAIERVGFYRIKIV